MLNGETFSEQLFHSKIFALMTNNIFFRDGIIHGYKNDMSVSKSGSNITISGGAVCIQGRLLEEDSSTTIDAGTDDLFCKLVIEIDLDKENTENDFQQGYYKILTSVSAYPTLTQTDIINNNSGVYQFELAKFKTSSNGITDLVNTSSLIYPIKDEINSIQTDIKNYSDSNNGAVQLKFTRWGNLVTVKIIAKINANKYRLNFINKEITVPNFAKVTNTGTMIGGCNIGGLSIDETNHKVTPSGICQGSISKTINNVYILNLIAGFETAGTYPLSDYYFELSGCYIIN